MRAAVQRSGLPVAAAVLLLGSLLLSGGTHSGPLLWLGAAALLLAGIAAAGAALGVSPPRLDAPARGFLGCLAGLVVWSGLSVVWSIQPDASWQFTNRTLVYLAFAALGVLIAPRLPARALAVGLAGLLGVVLGWALLTKAVPALYPDYGRIARLRAPLGYWNELGLLAVVAACLGLGIAAGRERRAMARAGGVLLVFAAVLAALLTYSRANIVLVALAAAAWLAFDRRRPEGLAALVLGALPALGVFGVALALPGITNNGTTHAQRVHDGWIFGVVVLAVGAAVVAAAYVLTRLEARRPVGAAARARLDRAARLLLAVAVVAAIAVAVVFAGRVWREFRIANDVSQGRGRLTSLGSGNRWGWWQQAWHAFVGHPGGGTGGGTFQLTNRLHRVDPFDVAREPHNTPLQFLSELGLPGLLLFLGAVGCGAWAVARARRRSREPLVTALGIGLAAWALHMVVDIDWSYVAVCGPLLFAAGVLAGSAPVEDGAVARTARRPLLAAAALAVAAVGVYSLAAPWLAQRELQRSYAAPRVADAYRHAQRARSWNPLSFYALEQLAATAPTDRQAARLYQQATRLEPLNPDAWYFLGAFAFEHGDMRVAYRALDRSWGLDRRDGPLAERCSILDVARRAVLHYGPICRG